MPSLPMNAPSGIERRSHPRVETRIPVRHRLLGVAMRERLRREIRTADAPQEMALDPALLAYLQRIERKLDWLISHVDDASPVPLSAGDLNLVSLSGSGLRFECSDCIPVGEEIALDFLLPFSKPQQVRGLGRVVRREAAQPGSSGVIAVAFTTIGERDREAIVRFADALRRRNRGSGSKGDLPGEC